MSKETVKNRIYENTKKYLNSLDLTKTEGFQSYDGAIYTFSLRYEDAIMYKHKEIYIYLTAVKPSHFYTTNDVKVYSTFNYSDGLKITLFFRNKCIGLDNYGCVNNDLEPMMFGFCMSNLSKFVDMEEVMCGSKLNTRLHSFEIYDVGYIPDGRYTEHLYYDLLNPLRCTIDLPLAMNTDEVFGLLLNPEKRILIRTEDFILKTKNLGRVIGFCIYLRKGLNGKLYEHTIMDTILKELPNWFNEFKGIKTTLTKN